MLPCGDSIKIVISYIRRSKKKKKSFLFIKDSGIFVRKSLKNIHQKIHDLWVAYPLNIKQKV